jgi:hypothetical protein
MIKFLRNREIAKQKESLKKEFETKSREVRTLNNLEKNLTKNSLKNYKWQIQVHLKDGKTYDFERQGRVVSTSNGPYINTDFLDQIKDFKRKDTITFEKDGIVFDTSGISIITFKKVEDDFEESFYTEEDYYYLKILWNYISPHTYSFDYSDEIHSWGDVECYIENFLKEVTGFRIEKTKKYKIIKG